MASENDQSNLHLEAYKVLVNMIQHDEILFWRRFEVFIFINGGLLTLLGLHNTLQIQMVSANDFAILVCFMGFALSLLWVFITSRGEAFYNLWYEQIKYLEEAYLAPIQIFRIADEYFATHRIKLGRKDLVLGFPAKAVHITRAVLLAIGAFAPVWLAALIGVLFVR